MGKKKPGQNHRNMTDHSQVPSREKNWHRVQTGYGRHAGGDRKSTS